MIDYPDGFDSTTMRRKGICGVLAVAICAGVSYKVAWEACKRHLPTGRQRMRSATNLKQRLAALKELAVKFTEMQNCIGMSVIDFCANRAVYGDIHIYMLRIRGHAFIYKAGFIIDQKGCIPWQKYHHPRVKLTSVVRIDGKGW